MKAIILAAGMGRRIKEAGWDQPKCLLPFGTAGLIDHLLAALLRVGVRDVVVVVGYQADVVRQAVTAHDVNATFIENPDYGSTNTINSLYLAREHMDDDFLYFNADVLFDWRILELLLGMGGNALAVDEGACGDEEVKVVVDSDNRIERIGKVLPGLTCRGEFIGVAKFDASINGDFISTLVSFNEDRNERNVFFEAAVDELLASHVCTSVPIGDLRAMEIDSPDDWRDAQGLWDAGGVASAITDGCAL
jgi:choline kinase